MRLSPLQIAGEIGGLLLLSIAAGAMLGAIYASAARAAEFGLFFGGLAGFVCSPLVIIALFGKNWRIGGLIMFGPAAVGALIAGRLFIYDSDEFGLLIVGAVWVAGIVAANIQSPDEYADDPFACTNCGYCLKGISSERCPECGSAVDRDDAGGRKPN